eukprot:3933866-Rhodomonas_salina.3
MQLKAGNLDGLGAGAAGARGHAQAARKAGQVLLQAVAGAREDARDPGDGGGREGEGARVGRGKRVVASLREGKARADRVGRGQAGCAGLEMKVGESLREHARSMADGTCERGECGGGGHKAEHATASWDSEFRVLHGFKVCAGRKGTQMVHRLRLRRKVCEACLVQASIFLRAVQQVQSKSSHLEAERGAGIQVGRRGPRSAGTGRAGPRMQMVLVDGRDEPAGSDAESQLVFQPCEPARAFPEFQQSPAGNQALSEPVTSTPLPPAPAQASDGILAMGVSRPLGTTESGCEAVISTSAWVSREGGLDEKGLSLGVVERRGGAEDGRGGRVDGGQSFEPEKRWLEESQGLGTSEEMSGLRLGMA